MVFKDRKILSFRISKPVLLLSTMQQVSVAASTYVMLHAAISIEHLAMDKLISAISYFVIFIFMAYFFLALAKKIQSLSRAVQKNRLSLYEAMSHHIDRTAYVPY